MHTNVYRTFFLLCILLILTTTSAAQEKVILAGVVTEKNAEPIPGVSIAINCGKTILGTMADINGKYAIEIPDSLDNFTIQYQFVGMITQRYLVKKDSVDKKKFIFNH
ncbi:MAG: hypothetical protein HC831_10920 [Chloroflexia bacterium]|nr:hypothetical protein [Chloroflexia bacterium]